MRQYLLLFVLLITTWGYTQISFAEKEPNELQKKYQENYQTTITIGGHRFLAEVVSTPTLLQKGMMYRPNISTEHAMLFVYKQPQRMSFWMKNMRMSLDILFFNAEGILQEIKADVPPCVKNTCPVYPAKQTNNQFVIEIKAGQADALGINVGDKLNVY